MRNYYVQVRKGRMYRDYDLADLGKAYDAMTTAIARANEYGGDRLGWIEANARDVRRVTSDYEIIEEYLIRTGVIPHYSSGMALNMELDELFPDIGNKEPVWYNGHRYRRRFIPGDQSRSGKTVYNWKSFWELYDNGDCKMRPDFSCGYYTTLSCTQCIHGGGRRKPDIKRNQLPADEREY